MHNGHDPDHDLTKNKYCKMKSQNHLKYLNNSKIIAQTKKKLFAFLHQSYIVAVIINIRIDIPYKKF